MTVFYRCVRSKCVGTRFCVSIRLEIWPVLFPLIVFASSITVLRTTEAPLSLVTNTDFFRLNSGAFSFRFPAPFQNKTNWDATAAYRRTSSLEKNSGLIYALLTRGWRYFCLQACRMNWQKKYVSNNCLYMSAWSSGFFPSTQTDSE